MTTTGKRDPAVNGILSRPGLLRTLRETALLTQEELAERAGLSARTVRDLELGKVARPRSATIRLLIDALRLTEAEVAAATAVAQGTAADLTTTGTVRPSQLPPDPGWFIGREAHLRRLDDLLLRDPRHRPAAMAIAAIAGTAGVGKTALVTHWAHRVRDRFLDGHLYVNLHGYSLSAPRDPIDALSQLLQALGMSADKVPVDVDVATAMYRSLLADKNTLIVLDNAQNADQVRPLLGGGPGCAVVVTSRDRLTGLTASHDVRRIALDVLPAADAVAVIASIVGDARTVTDPDAVAALARLCGDLPLALRIAAANLSCRPHLPIAEYVSALGRGNRLAKLSTDDDPHTAVHVAFDASYRALPSEAQRLFRLLGLIPGPEFGIPAVAALAGIAAESAERALDRLAAAHLVVEHQPHRYTFHDLIRLYASRRAEQDESAPRRQTATTLMYGWYLATVTSAGRTLFPDLLRMAVPEDGPCIRFDDRAAASSWLDAELPNLVAIATHTSRHGPFDVAWLMADTLRGYFARRRETVGWLTVAIAGLAAAESAGDIKAQAACHQSIAQAHHCAGRYQQAIEHNGHALTMSKRSNWPEGQATVLGHLGNAYLGLGKLDQAAAHYQPALETNRQIGRPIGEAASLANLGIVYARLGRLGKARDNFTEALRIQRQHASISAQAVTLANLGEVNHDLGLLDQALSHLSEAHTLSEQVGSMDGQANTLIGLAGVHCDAGRLDEALDCSRSALVLVHTADDRRTQADALNVHARVHSRRGQHHEAIELNTRALRLTRAIGNRSGEAVALIGIAHGHLQGNHVGPATQHARRALAVATDAGYRVLEAQALDTLTTICHARGRSDEAAKYAERAIAIREAFGS